MLARDLISDGIVPLMTSETGAEAISWMEEYRVVHLPIVNNNQLLGVVSENDLLQMDDLEVPLGSINLVMSNAFVFEYQHIYNVLNTFSELKLSLVPVVDEKNNFLGNITLQKLIEELAIMSSAGNPGGIIVLEMDQNSYSLAEIAQIIEYNDAKVLNVCIKTYPDSTSLEVTVKINKNDIEPILQTFARYDYTVKASYSHKEGIDKLRERYDSLMNYLNI